MATVAGIDATVVAAGITAAGAALAAVVSARRTRKDERGDSNAVVSQQSILLRDMQTLIDELQDALDRCRASGVAKENQIAQLEKTIETLRDQLRSLRDD